MKKIVILGSTGSIGTQCLDIIRDNKEKYKVTALTCGSNTELLAHQIEEFGPELAVTGTAEDAEKLKYCTEPVDWKQPHVLTVTWSSTPWWE